MITIPSGFLDGHVTALQVCWVVVRRDGEVIYGTECDENIPITTGNYVGTYLARAGITGSDIRSSSDLSVDNLEVTGALQEAEEGDSSSSSSSLTIFDLSAADLEAGMFDNAEAITFLVNPLNPNLYQRVLRSGWLGNVTRTAEGQYKTELRGFTQALSQGIVKNYSIGCHWELGSTPDSNPPGLCRVDMTAHTTTSDVIAVVTQRRVFTYSSPSLDTFGQVPGGTITWTSGANAGYSMEIKAHDLLPGPDQVTLFLPMPADIAAGDTFTFRAGCDKKHSTCFAVYNNIPNFGGWGHFVPGDSEILKVGKKG